MFGDLIPCLESGGEFGAVVGGAHAVPRWAEVWGNATERREKPLRGTDSPETPLHRTFTLPVG